MFIFCENLIIDTFLFLRGGEFSAEAGRLWVNQRGRICILHNVGKCRRDPLSVRWYATLLENPALHGGMQRKYSAHDTETLPHNGQKDGVKPVGLLSVRRKETAPASPRGPFLQAVLSLNPEHGTYGAKESPSCIVISDGEDVSCASCLSRSYQLKLPATESAGSWAIVVSWHIPAVWPVESRSVPVVVIVPVCPVRRPVAVISTVAVVPGIAGGLIQFHPIV